MITKRITLAEYHAAMTRSRERAMKKMQARNQELKRMSELRRQRQEAARDAGTET